MKFNVNLKKYRKEKGLTATQFAELLGIKYLTYRNYEGGSTEPKYETLIKIADLLDVSLDELLGRESVQLKKAGDLFSIIGGEIVIDGKTIFLKFPFHDSEHISTLVFFSSDDFLKFVDLVRDNLKNSFVPAIDNAIWETRTKPYLDEFCNKQPQSKSMTDDVKLFSNFEKHMNEINLPHFSFYESFFNRAVSYVMRKKGFNPVWKEQHLSDESIYWLIRAYMEKSGNWFSVGSSTPDEIQKAEKIIDEMSNEELKEFIDDWSIKK